MNTLIYASLKNTFRELTDMLLPVLSKYPEIYTEEDKDVAAELMVDSFFSDEELDNMKIRHAEFVISDMDQEIEENMCA